MIGKRSNYFAVLFSKYGGEAPMHNLEYLALLLKEKPNEMFKAIRYEEKHETHNEMQMIKKVGEIGDDLNECMTGIETELEEIRENLKAMMEELGVKWRETKPWKT